MMICKEIPRWKCGDKVALVQSKDGYLIHERDVDKYYKERIEEQLERKPFTSNKHGATYMTGFNDGFELALKDLEKSLLKEE